MSFFQKLFGFQGRMRRRDFWIYSLVVSLATYLILYAVSMARHETFRGLVKEPLILTLDYILLMWPKGALAAKRGQDLNIRPELSIALYAAIQVLGLVPVWFPKWNHNLLYYIPLVTLSIVYWVVYATLDGTRGPNRYGPSPKGFGDEVQEVFA